MNVGAKRAGHRPDLDAGVGGSHSLTIGDGMAATEGVGLRKLHQAGRSTAGSVGRAQRAQSRPPWERRMDRGMRRLLCYMALREVLLAPMTKKPQPRFDPDKVRALAGDRSFARGDAYHRGGHVNILSLSADRVLAEVTGTERYRVELSGHGRTIDGSCTCPAFEDYGFCKHMVATAFAVNAMGPEGAAAADALGRIRAYLGELDADALIAMMVDLAERDLTLFRKLESAASIARADDKTLEASLRNAIDRATRTGGYLEYGAVGGWAAEMGVVLDTIARLASGGRGALAFGLIEHALRRIAKAVESIDDSDGHGGALLGRAQEIHLAAVIAARPDPVKLARDLFARETGGLYDTFYDAAELYAEALGDNGLAEYRRLAAKAWSKVPARMGKRHVAESDTVDQSRVAAILDHFAERDNDLEARIAIRTKDLSSPWRYLELAEFCRQLGREQEALRYAEEGLWIFEDDGPDRRLVSLAVELLIEVGRKGDAMRHLWRAFEQAPTFEMYTQISDLGGKETRRRSLAILEARLGKPRAGFWGHPADLLVRVLIHEKKFDEAWAAVQRHGASEQVKEVLIQATETTRPRDAIAFYAAKVERLANSGAGDSYKEAAELIARVAKLRDPAEHAAYVADIRERFRRRRNFMKLLG
ncbi:MAG TPA: SWIM zinc finger family protein [Dongiaceae bacterium]|nr:SWIM zinc finger family protein [Dongiaceae bacterium]